MRMIVRNIKLFTALVAVFFLISSSGFTSILHSCLMGGMACCMSTMQHAYGRTEQSHQPMALHLNSAMTGCCSTTIVGGLSTSMALLEKPNRIEHSKPVVVAVNSIVPELTPHFKSSSEYLFLVTGNILPSPVERYVLNASFLI